MGIRLCSLGCIVAPARPEIKTTRCNVMFLSGNGALAQPQPAARRPRGVLEIPV
jgi:hypothetical protein